MLRWTDGLGNPSYGGEGTAGDFFGGFAAGHLLGDDELAGLSAQCGQPLRADDRFCGACGAAVRADAT